MRERYQWFSRKFSNQDKYCFSVLALWCWISILNPYLLGKYLSEPSWQGNGIKFSEGRGAFGVLGKKALMSCDFPLFHHSIFTHAEKLNGEKLNTPIDKSLFLRLSSSAFLCHLRVNSQEIPMTIPPRRMS